MTILREIRNQPFIVATGLAALVHSTWTLGTLFTGPEPAQLSLEWFLWLFPAFLISFALDVGQIVTSAEIRAGERTRAKYATFAVFSCAVYFLQWNYIAHHIPATPLAAGVRTDWQPIATTIRDSALWILPALLPLSTLLYTASSSRQPAPNPTQRHAQPSKIVLAEQPDDDPSDTVSIVETDSRWGVESPANIVVPRANKPPTDNGR